MTIDQYLASIGGLIGLVMGSYTAFQTVMTKRRKADAEIVRAETAAEAQRAQAIAQANKDKADSDRRAVELEKLKDEMHVEFLTANKTEIDRLRGELRSVRVDMQSQYDEVKAELEIYQNWVTLCNERLVAAGLQMVAKPTPKEKR